MQISHNWLSEFIQLDEPVDEIAEVLTQVGLEVENVETVEKVKGGLRGLVIGKVIECQQHPNADRLKMTLVDVGEETHLNIVCGAPNVAEDQKVIVAPVGTIIHPIKGDSFTIKRAKIRGEVSEGMICAEDEIGLGESHDGIMVLNTDLPVGSPASELFDVKGDTVYEIGLTPNRGDAASHFGTARDLKAYYQRKLNFPQANSFVPRPDRPIQVEVQNVEACPRYSGVTIRGTQVKPSPAWLQDRLHSIGLTPINNLVDITNYVCHGLGQPLHAFDAAQIKGDKVIVRTTASGTKFKTLDEKERTLHDQDLMICDSEKGMCIAGVFGGIHSGVNDKTTDIFLESAYFSADWIRATAQRHGLSTDASFRYERGTDPEMTIIALKYATSLILEIAGGYVASDFIDLYPTPIVPKRVKTSYHTFDRLIGKALPRKEINRILTSLDIEILKQDEKYLEVEVPTYRSEVTRPADLVEEVLRIHGINNVDIDESFSTDFLAEFKEEEPYKVQENLSKFLAGKGYLEILTNSLTNDDYHQKLKLEGDPVEILNRSSEDLGIMKTSPLYTSLEVLRHNINRRQTNLRFFEFPRTYLRSTEGLVEKEWVTWLMTGGREETWQGSKGAWSIHELIGDVSDSLTFLNIQAVQKKTLDADRIFSYGIQLSIRGREIGKIGVVNPNVLSVFSIEQPVFFGQLSWTMIMDLVGQKIVFEDIPKFPEVRRDLSLVLDKGISYEEIEAIAFKSDKKLLNRVNVFSVYEGDRIGDDKKSYAISFYLQDKSKTLDDREIDKVMDRLIKEFEEKLGAIIRR